MADILSRGDFEKIWKIKTHVGLSTHMGTPTTMLCILG